MAPSWQTRIAACLSAFSEKSRPDMRILIISAHAVANKRPVVNSPDTPDLGDVPADVEKGGAALLALSL